MTWASNRTRGRRFKEKKKESDIGLAWSDCRGTESAPAPRRGEVRSWEERRGDVGQPEIGSREKKGRDAIRNVF